MKHFHPLTRPSADSKIMQTSHHCPPSRYHVPIMACLLVISAAFASAANVTWDAGGGTDKKWSTTTNWNPDGSPASNVVYFGETGETTTSGTSSIVDQNTSIAGLNFNNTGTTAGDWQVLQINSGVTLTTTNNNNVVIGGVANSDATASITTQVKFTGSGSFLMNASGKTFAVGNGNANNSATVSSFATLDASTLASFTIWAASVNIGVGQENVGTLYLGTTNAIHATSLTVGNTSSSGGAMPTQSSALYLGHTNTIDADTINVGFYRSSGLIQFQNNLAAGASVTIRGRTATRATMYVGSTADQFTITTPPSGLVDFRGGSVDAMLDTLVIGRGTRSGSYGSPAGSGGGANGQLYMDQGSIDARIVYVGISTNAAGTANAGTAAGALNVAGGTFRAGELHLGESAGQPATGNLNISGSGAVTIAQTVDSSATSGDIIMGGEASATSAGASQAVINLAGGSLTVTGNIYKGAAAGPGTVTATINLRGGTLDMDGGNITIDVLNAESGTLRNLNQFNSGAALVKSTSGTLILSGVNSYTGATQVNGGTLLVNGDNSAATGSVSVASGAMLGGTGIIGGHATIADGGILSAGQSAGKLTFSGNLTLAGASTQSIFEIASGVRGTNYDAVDVGGQLLYGGDLVFAMTGLIGNGTYNLFDFSNQGGSFDSIVFGGVGNPYSGTFVNVAGVWTATSGDQSFIFTQSTGDLVVQAVPEPSTWVLLAVGFFAVRFVFRRRNPVLN